MLWIPTLPVGLLRGIRVNIRYLKTHSFLICRNTVGYRGQLGKFTSSLLGEMHMIEDTYKRNVDLNILSYIIDCLICMIRSIDKSYSVQVENSISIQRGINGRLLSSSTWYATRLFAASSFGESL